MPHTVERAYIIIGAGPAGLQLGHLLGTAGREYLILEARERPGAFFDAFPRHRALLSINKIHNRYPEPDYNLRHDWNSLLSTDESLLFRTYSKDLFPDAGDLVRYLRDFAERLELRVRYSTRVKRVLRRPGGGFELTDSSGAVYRCRCLVMATGAVAEYVPSDIKGIDHATTYAQHSLDVAKYENKRVAILGGGNSAFEVAKHLAGAASVIHLLVREPVRHAWETHFVGDLRAVNNEVLDMYQLKSLHATLGLIPRQIEPNADGSFALHLEEDVPHWSRPATFRIVNDYDHVIICTGWKYIDTSVFASDCVPHVDADGRYPVLSSCWESSVPDLYYAGTAMAARDKKAASGFIHGFRYNVRTLYHLLEEKYHNKPLPSTTFALTSELDLRKLATHIIERVSTSSAMYQLNGFLCDAVVLSPAEARYLPELPVELVHERTDLYGSECLVTITLEYGFHNYPSTSRSVDFIHPSDIFEPSCGAFLHPVFRFWTAGKKVDEQHLGESLMVRYDRHFSRNSFCDDFDARYGRVNQNKVMNFVNQHSRTVDKQFSTDFLPAGAADSVFRFWPRSEIEAREASEEELQQRDRSRPCRSGGRI